MTRKQERFVELELERTRHKEYFAELQEATQAVADEIGVNSYFEDDYGTVYKVVSPKGRWVDFESIGYLRTKREEEIKGSLSAKEAKEAGFGT